MDRHISPFSPFPGSSPAPARSGPPSWLSRLEELGGVRAAPAILPAAGGRRVGASHGPDQERGIPDVTSTASEAMDLAQARRVALEELTRQGRLILSLRYADGLGFDEIAEVLDTPPAAVEKLYRQTMATLEERLG